MRRRVFAVAVVAAFPVAWLATAPASVHGQVLTFEGLQHNEEVLDFHNGGTGSLGSSGPNYGISFSSAALAIIDEDDDPAATGRFENNPSGITAVSFVFPSPSLVMNVLAGFTTGFSFFYSADLPATVSVWSGLDGTGVLLASLDLEAQHDVDCPPFGPGRTGAYCNWTAVGVAFAGTAMSVDFAGAANRVGFDDITIGSSVPGTPVPEPLSMVLLGTGLAGVAMLHRRRRRGLTCDGAAG